MLNIKDHIRNGEVQRVAAWHCFEITGMGFKLDKLIEVKTPSNRFGKNASARVDHEKLCRFIKL